mmetsp:Transcript_17410/g.39316  ORF Transcript_17410/g.39316 Transcript_17410/m.39316 type:complete len:82 (+) Transcript_17410:125-370(+)
MLLEKRLKIILFNRINYVIIKVIHSKNLKKIALFDPISLSILIGNLSSSECTDVQPRTQGRVMQLGHMMHATGKKIENYTI